MTPFFGASAVFGGMDSAVQFLCHAISNHGIRVTILTTDLGMEGAIDGSETCAPGAGREFRVFRAPVSFHGLSSLTGIHLSPDFFRLAHRALADVDLVHFHSVRSWQNLMAGISTQLLGKDYVVQTHGSAPLNLGRRMSKGAYDLMFGAQHIQGARAVVVNSELELGAVRGLGVEPARIHLVPNGIDAQFWSSGKVDRWSFRRGLGIGDDDFVVLYVGRLDHTKGLSTLVSAFAGLCRINPDSKLLLVGPDFGVRTSLVRMCESLRLVDKVVFAGALSRTDVRAAYRAATITVLPSTYESFGLAALEAAAAGSAVLVTSECGVAEIWTAVGATIVEPNEGALLAALARYSQDSSLVDHQARCLRSIPWHEFTWDKIGKTLVELYEGIVTTRHGRD